MNVRFSQIEECIRTSLFAIDNRPQNPPLHRGEELLLQLTKDDATEHDLLDRRIQFALIFEREVPDPTGERSRQHWPNAEKTWKWILECSDTIPTIPFSLERLNLSRDYGGRGNAQYIEPQDEEIIRPFLKGSAQAHHLPAQTTVRDLLDAIRNYDTVVRLAPRRTTRVREYQRRLADPWLSDALKSYYEHRCQVCLHDFKPRYGVPFADTRFLVPLDAGGEPVSRNTVVVCPNHDGIIGAARPEFDPGNLTFRYANGLVEKITLRDHLL